MDISIFHYLDVLPAFIGAVTAGLGLASSVIGGIKAGQQRKKQQEALNNEKEVVENNYNKDYYQDYTQRSDNQMLLKNLKDNLMQTSKAEAGRAAVTGATPEAVAAAKQQSNDTLANATGQIAANGSAYKDNVMNRYMNQRQNLLSQQSNLNQQSAASWTNLMQGGLNVAAGSLGSMANAALNTPRADKTTEALAAPEMPTLGVSQPKYPTSFGG